jgi:hypothetical protein
LEVDSALEGPVKLANVVPGPHPMEMRRMPVEVQDLSEGGVRVALSSATEIPADCWISLESGDGLALTAPVTVRQHYPSATGGIFGLSFGRLSTEQHTTLIAMMFTPAERWRGVRYTDDKVLLSAARVALSPIIGFIVHRWWGRQDPNAGLPVGDGEGVVLNPRPSWGVLVIGLGSLIFGARGYLGWRQSESLVPTVAEGSLVSARTQKDELGVTLQTLRELKWEAKMATMPLSPGLSEAWDKHVWAVRLELERDDPDANSGQGLLQKAALGLQQVGQTIRSGATGPEVGNALDGVEAVLNRAEAQLRKESEEGT